METRIDLRMRRSGRKARWCVLLGSVIVGVFLLAAPVVMRLSSGPGSAGSQWAFFAVQWHSQSQAVSGPYSTSGLPEASVAKPVIMVEVPAVRYKHALFAPVLQIRSLTLSSVPDVNTESRVKIADAIWVALENRSDVEDIERWFSRDDIDVLLQKGQVSSSRVYPLGVAYFVSAAALAVLVAVQVILFLVTNKIRFWGPPADAELQCKNCGYSLNGLERCPECNTIIDAHAQENPD